jgi:hypothetical protein
VQYSLIIIQYMEKSRHKDIGTFEGAQTKLWAVSGEVNTPGGLLRGR